MRELTTFILTAALAVQSPTDTGILPVFEPLPYAVQILGPISPSGSPILRLSAPEPLPPFNPDDLEIYLWNGSAALEPVGLTVHTTITDNDREITFSTSEHFSRVFPRLPEHNASPFFLIVTHNNNAAPIIAFAFVQDARPPSPCPDDRPANCFGTCSTDTECRYFEPNTATMLWLPIYRELQDDPAFFYSPQVINTYGPASDAELLVEAHRDAFAFRPDSLRLFAVTDHLTELTGDFAFLDDDNRTLLLTIPRDALKQPPRGRILFLLAAANRQNLPLLFAFIVTPRG